MTVPFPLAIVDFQNPLLWAVLIGWILSVVLHEFGHGIVAHFGGDYTIRERGGLTLNPIQYIDPVFSIAFPALIFVMGGVPLPGGVTYIRRDLIRTRAWQIAVSAAGPAMNCLIFLALIIPFHPRIGWLEPPDMNAPVIENWKLFVGAMAWLQMLSVLFNLVPVPPLDGYQIVEQFLPDDTREKIRSMSTTLFFIYFLVLWRAPGAFAFFHRSVAKVLQALGFDRDSIIFFFTSFNRVLFGSS